MYPYPIIFGMALYEILIAGGMILVLLLADKMGIKRGFSVKLQKLVIINAVASIVIGFVGAVLFQAFYNFKESGTFVINQNTGMTFYGGLIFGVISFLLIWFFGSKAIGIGAEAKTRFKDIADIAAFCIPLAHGFGRLGCLFAGCCHGEETNAWYGIKMLTYEKINDKVVEVWKTFVPVQLFEAIFLFVLMGIMLLLYFKLTGKKRIPLLPIYAAIYGVWRFCLEFARGDDRGETIVPFLSPSQLVAIIMFIAAVVYFVVWFIKFRTPQRLALENAESIEMAEQSEAQQVPQEKITEKEEERTLAQNEEKEQE